MADLLIYESGNGGDLNLRGNDLEGIEGYANMPYLSMFGGSDWWGNTFLDGDAKFESKTEKVLNEVALNSAGRIKIEAAIKADLAHLIKNVPGTKIGIITSITSPDRLEVNINIDGQLFYFNWNPSTGFMNYKA